MQKKITRENLPKIPLNQNGNVYTQRVFWGGNHRGNCGNCSQHLRVVSTNVIPLGLETAEEVLSLDMVKNHMYRVRDWHFSKIDTMGI